jgi:RHS repeat-associated protein
VIRVLAGSVWRVTVRYRGRIKSAPPTASGATANCGSAASQTFSYDPFGNLYKTGSPYSFEPTYTVSTNHMATLPSFTPTYDANGNVLTDSINTYAWDADGNSTTVGSVTLTFDALDRMVEQDHSGTYTEIVYAPTGAKLALMSGTGGSTLQKAFVPLPGKALAVYTSSGLNHYRHSDWLGSTRLTSSTTQTYLSSLAYDPFGGTYATSGTTDPSFTEENPDTVSGDYDFLFREYSNVGRWVSPDPAGMSAVDPTNPQSWNRYAYVLNNPLANVDPLGLCAPNDYTCDTGSGPINNGGNSGDCSVDGAAVSCSSLSWNSGIYLLCPNNSCDRAAGGRDSNATPSPDPIPAGGSTR